MSRKSVVSSNRPLNVEKESKKSLSNDKYIRERENPKNNLKSFHAPKKKMTTEQIEKLIEESLVR